MIALLRVLAVPMRMFLMVLAMLSFFWGNLQGVGLYAAIFAGAVSVFAGVLFAKSTLRKRMLFLGAGCMILGTWFIGYSLGYFTIFAQFFGVPFALYSQLIVYGFGFVFAIATLLRALAIRMPAVYAIEFWAIAFSAAVAFAPHRNHIVLYPLWLSDYAWTVGLEPTFLLSAVGVLLALMLSMITLLEKTERFPLVLLFLPLLGLLVFRYVDPTELNQEEPPQRENSILEQLDGRDPLFQLNRGQGGQGKRDPREETASGNGEGENQKDDGEGGQRSPIAVVLLETDFTPESQYFYLRQEGLSKYTGTRLVASRDRNIPYDGMIGFPPGPAQSSVMPPAGEERIAIKGTVSLLAPHTSPFGIRGIFPLRGSIYTLLCLPSLMGFAQPIEHRNQVVIVTHSLGNFGVATDDIDLFNLSSPPSKPPDNLPFREWVDGVHSINNGKEEAFILNLQSLGEHIL